MRVFPHLLAVVALTAHLGVCFVLLFLDGAAYTTMLFVPIPLVWVLVWLGRRIPVILYVGVGAAATALLVFGRWTIDSWLHVAS